jgi:hypothetical protein
LNELEARAKYDGLQATSGIPTSRFAEVVGKISVTKTTKAAVPETTSDNHNQRLTSEGGKKTAGSMKEMKRASSAIGNEARGAQAETSSEPARVIAGPAEDKNIPTFFKKFADENGFGNVHMALRVGVLVFEIGVPK